MHSKGSAGHVAWHDQGGTASRETCPLLLRGAHPVLSLLRSGCSPERLERVAAWLDRRSEVTHPGLARDLDELEVWLDMPDPVLTATRLTHLLASCLVAGPSEPGAPGTGAPELDAHGLALQLARWAGTTGPAREASLSVLLLALGVVGPGVAAALWVKLDRRCGPAELSGAVAALGAVADYVQGCFGLPELTAGTLLRELA